MIAGHPWGDVWTIFRKELIDALRDRRTLGVVLISSVLMGPLVLFAISTLVGAMEQRAEQREIYVAGIEHAPSLKNFLERQTYRVKTAPADYERQLRDARLGDPVLVVSPDFEARIAHGEAASIELVSDSANARAEQGSARVARLLAAFSRERTTLNLALRGVSAELLEPLQVEEHDLANAQTRAIQLTGMMPFFVMMALLYGALNAALDTTAGERERGSLEPLLMNPTERWALVVGKWGAVVCLSMLIAALSCFSFLPGQWLLRSDTLSALFQFGLREALGFLCVLLPFAAALSALLMAVAIRCKTFKEAQASSTLVVLGVALMPPVMLFNPSGEAPWHLWVPALAQQGLMTHLLKGEDLSTLQVMIPSGACTLLTVLGIGLVARGLRTAAIR